MKEFLPLVGEYLSYVSENGERGLITLCNCTVPSEVLVREHTRLKLELSNMPGDEKQETWNFVCRTFPEHNQQQKMVTIYLFTLTKNMQIHC
jgi:hypothetical protein